MLAKIVTGNCAPVTIWNLERDFDFLWHLQEPVWGVLGFGTVAGEAQKTGNGSDGTNT